VLGVDREARTAVVEPGAVHATLQRAAVREGLRFGPDPSTHTRCTIGGMIGNNACGSRALGYGRTVDNVVSLDVLTSGGVSLEEPSLVKGLDALVADHLATIRTELGRFTRQVSGYSLEHLLPENGRDLSRFLVGSEGTLGVVLGATVRLVADAPHRALAVLGYPSVFDAGDAVPRLLTHPLVACEGLDLRIVDVVRHNGGAVPDLPRGSGWLFAEVTGDTREETEAAAAAVIRDAEALDARVVSDPAEMAALWRIREDGPASRPAAWPTGAVRLGGRRGAPERLGRLPARLRRAARRTRSRRRALRHFGDGCVHVRIDFPLREARAAGGYRAFVEAAADLTAAHGGSLSGEHGDGRARSALLPRMYSAEVISLFAGGQAPLRPRDLLNPGCWSPPPVEADIRLAATVREPRPHLRLVHERGSSSNAGVQPLHTGRQVPREQHRQRRRDVPSYEREPATRRTPPAASARVLAEMVNGSLVTTAWRSDEVHEALEPVPVPARACASDCPTGIDMDRRTRRTLHQR
jgi:FAD/FMN-containing dehydrogenase